MSGRRYFVAATGNDHDPGTVDRPWQTIGRAQTEQLLRGDTLAFRGGDTFTGSLKFENISGPAEQFLVITSWGSAPAIIVSELNAIEILNSFGVEISRLKILGNAASAEVGIRFLNSEPGHRGPIKIEYVEVSKFANYGISIESSEKCIGHDGIKILHAHVHHIGNSGIQVCGKFSSHESTYAHANVLIEGCQVHDVHGIAGLHSHSGNGIVISDVDGGLIDECRAHDNGTLNTTPRCGPLGIWAWDCRNVIIQNCESFRNRTASVTDGGGFGLDGGSSHCTLRNNSSYENDGAGYTLSQFEGARPFHDCVVEGNSSRDDARRNQYGAIHVWCALAGGIDGVRITSNKIHLGKALWGESRAIRVQGSTSHLTIEHNEFSSVGALFVAEIDDEQNNLQWKQNTYSSASSQFTIAWINRVYHDLKEWLTHLER